MHCLFAALANHVYNHNHQACVTLVKHLQLPNVLLLIKCYTTLNVTSLTKNESVQSILY